MSLLVLLRWSLPRHIKITITPSLAFLCLALLGHFGGGDSSCWLVMLAGALWDHFPACLPSFVGDPLPASEQLHYPPPNPSLAMTSAEHLTEISLSCGGSYSPTDLCFPFCGCSWLVSLPCLCSWRQHGLCSCAVVGPEFWGNMGHEHFLVLAAQALTSPSQLSGLCTALSRTVSDTTCISLIRVFS